MKPVFTSLDKVISAVQSIRNIVMYDLLWINTTLGKTSLFLKYVNGRLKHIEIHTTDSVTLIHKNPSFIFVID